MLILPVLHLSVLQNRPKRGGVKYVLKKFYQKDVEKDIGPKKYIHFFYSRTNIPLKCTIILLSLVFYQLEVEGIYLRGNRPQDLVLKSNLETNQGRQLHDRTERWRTEKISTGPFNFRQSEQLSAALKTSFIISLILYFLKIKLFWAIFIPDVNFSWNPCFITKIYFYFLGFWSWETSDRPKK